jgi:hypothetical protein
MDDHGERFERYSEDLFPHHTFFSCLDFASHNTFGESDVNEFVQL